LHFDGEGLGFDERSDKKSSEKSDFEVSNKSALAVAEKSEKNEGKTFDESSII
jgi:hypothetical protein